KPMKRSRTFSCPHEHCEENNSDEAVFNSAEELLLHGFGHDTKSRIYCAPCGRDYLRGNSWKNQLATNLHRDNMGLPRLLKRKKIDSRVPEGGGADGQHSSQLDARHPDL